MFLKERGNQPFQKERLFEHRMIVLQFQAWFLQPFILVMGINNYFMVEEADKFNLIEKRIIKID